MTMKLKLQFLILFSLIFLPQLCFSGVAARKIMTTGKAYPACTSYTTTINGVAFLTTTSSATTGVQNITPTCEGSVVAVLECSTVGNVNAYVRLVVDGSYTGSELVCGTNMAGIYSTVSVPLSAGIAHTIEVTGSTSSGGTIHAGTSTTLTSGYFHVPAP